MQRDCHIRFAKSLVKVVRQHGLGAVNGLFAGLADQHQRAVPLALERSHVAGHADHCRDVHIMSAGVHHTNLLPCRILRPYLAAIGQLRVFGHRQRIKVCADQQRGSGTILQNPHHAVGLRAIGILADALRHRISGLAQFVCQHSRQIDNRASHRSYSATVTGPTTNQKFSYRTAP